MAAPNQLDMFSPRGLADRVLLRVADPEFRQLRDLVFRRYPDLEWATFAQFGWRPTPTGLVITLAAIDSPKHGDLNERVGHVAIDEQYTLRMALNAEKHRLAVGVIHSHPQNCAPAPSRIDDDMDTYYAKYFADFAPNRPYISLILSKMGRLVISGRVFWRGSWLQVEHTAAERIDLDTWCAGIRGKETAINVDRAARFASAFGERALRRLRHSTAAIIGVGGTGSAAAEVLARAGVGHLILVDPDVIESSNLERIHGAYSVDANGTTAKVLVAKRHIREIDPSITVDALVGRLPQDEVIDAVVTADVAIGCTDQQHSRLALSDLAFRYLLPSLDCGVVLEGKNGQVTGQVAQFVRFLSTDPCALCRGMVDTRRVMQELMSDVERSLRQVAATDAIGRGDDPNPYWQQQPQINTVGYLTTIVGAMVAGYAIGWLTGSFDAPFERMQMNLVAKYLDVTDSPQQHRSECVCGRFHGWADQGAAESLMSAPEHWPAVSKV